MAGKKEATMASTFAEDATIVARSVRKFLETLPKTEALRGMIFDVQSIEDRGIEILGGEKNIEW